jgi:Recombination endonuclease VII
MGMCSIEGCGRDAHERGWCNRHYKLWYRYGDPLAVRRQVKNLPSCTIEECPKPVVAQDLCGMHYRRLRLNGDPHVARTAVVIADGKKMCTQCKMTMPLESFFRNKRTRDGRGTWCKSCHTAHVLAKRALDPEAWRASARANAQRWRDANKEESARRVRAAHLMKNYGLTVEQYDELLERQDGRCGLCHQELTTQALDHDHETGAVRGIIHTRCNLALALLGDSLEGVQRALDYLTRTTGPL